MASAGSEVSMADFAIEAALLQGYQPHNNDDLEVAIPCRCYGRGLTREDFANLRWPAAMLAAAAGHSKPKKVRTVERRPAETAKKELSPIHKEPKLCSRGRGQLMSRSAAEYDMIQSRRSSRSSGQTSRRVGSIASEEENDVAWRAAGLPKGYVCHNCNVPGHHIQDCPSGRIPKGYVCRTCNVPGHLIQDCPSGVLAEGYICHKCNKPGHHIEDCPANHAPKGYICHACNEPGHHIKDCPSGGLPKDYVCHACNVPGHHIKDCPYGGLPKEYICRACNVPGHHIQDCPTKTEKDRRSEKSDWRARSPVRSESPENSVPSRESSQPPFRGSSRLSTPSPPIQSISELDFFRPEWLEKQNDKQSRNQRQTLDIKVNVSKTKTSGFGMNDVNRTPKSSALSQQAWEDSDQLFSKSNMESGFHISSHDDADLFMQFGGFKPVVKKQFNLQTEEFPDLGAEPKEADVQPKERRLTDKKSKSKSKKVKMVSYNLKENSPSKQSCGIKTLPQPATYSHAVQTPKDCQMMVQGLPIDCVESEVMNLMEPYGQVVYINMQKDQSGYASAIVGLDSPEKVEWVIDCLSGAESLFNGVDVPLMCYKVK